MFPAFALMSRMIGIEPGISIMANNTIKAAAISTKLILI
jgi:hypothetical protein